MMISADTDSGIEVCNDEYITAFFFVLSACVFFCFEFSCLSFLQTYPVAVKYNTYIL